MNLYRLNTNNPPNAYDRLGLDTMEQCEKALRDAVSDPNSRINKLRKALRDEGCPEPKAYCICCEKSYDAYFDVARNALIFCYNNRRLEETTGNYGMDTSYEAALYHEFVHAWQRCAGEKPQGWSKCRYAMCREIQAYAAANCPDSQTRKQCIRSGALSSAKETCDNEGMGISEMEKLFEELYEGCSKF